MPRPEDRDEAARICKETNAKDLCVYLVRDLLPALKKLYDDHKKVYRAVARLEYMVHYSLTSDQVGGPVLVKVAGDPPDPDSPPEGPPPFPPE